MPRSPRFKVYTAGGAYEGCVKHLESAAALVSVLGDGATVRNGHAKNDTIWTEGADGDALDYDHATETMLSRLKGPDQ